MGLDDDPRPEILTTRFCRYSLIHPARLRPWERSPIAVASLRARRELRAQTTAPARRGEPVDHVRGRSSSATRIPGAEGAAALITMLGARRLLHHMIAVVVHT